MKTRFCFIIAIISILLSCQKEKTTSLNAEIVPLQTAAKLYIDNGHDTYWTDGDDVWINGNTYTVTYDNNKSVIHNVEANETYTAIYPAGIYRSGSNGGDISIYIDSIQDYHVDGGAQLLRCPLAAYCSNGSTLSFHNLGALLRVDVTNSSNETICMKTIKVSSTNAILSGGGTVSFSGTPSLTMNQGHGCAMLSFADTNEFLSPSATKSYYLSLPAFSEKDVVIEVMANSTTTNYTYRKSNLNTSISTNWLAVAPAVNTLTPMVFFGSGSSADPYQISNYNDLCIMEAKVRSNSSYRSAYYVVTQDIDCGDNIVVPIGKNTTQCLNGGHFDGQNHTISINNISPYTVSPYNYLGLFGVISNNSTICNLTIQGNITVNFTTQYDTYASALCGQAVSSTIDNCINKVNLTITANTGAYICSIGGICGYCDGIITNCTNTGNLNIPEGNSRIWVGGIIGWYYSANDNIIKGLANTGNITLISTSNTASSLYNYHNTIAGGIIGHWGKQNNTEVTGNAIRDSYNTGSISATNNANTYTGGVCSGGIVGSSLTHASTIGNCYNTGTISATQPNWTAYAAGIIAAWHPSEDNTIEICLNTTSITNGYSINAVGHGECKYCYYPDGTSAVDSGWDTTSCSMYTDTKQPSDLNSWISSYGDGKYTQW